MSPPAPNRFSAGQTGGLDALSTHKLAFLAAVAQPFDMHDRRGLGIAFAVIFAGALAVMIWPSRPRRCPLVLNIASVEPAGIIDDAREEMWLVTLSLSNSDAGLPSPQNSVYFRNGGKGIEIKVRNHWIEVDAALDWALAPGQKHEMLLLMPAGTDACRIRLKYTGSRLVNGRLLWIAERLPQFVRFRMSYKFWRWVGFTRYGPNSHWREVILELPLPSTSGRPASISDDTHDPWPPLDALFALRLQFAGHRPDAGGFCVSPK